MKLPKSNLGEAQVINSTLPTPAPFSKMNPLAGCLSDTQSAVEFGLSAFQRKCIAEAINIPIMLYNNPATCGVDMSPQLMLSLVLTIISPKRIQIL